MCATTTAAKRCIRIALVHVMGLTRNRPTKARAKRTKRAIFGHGLVERIILRN